MPDVFDITGQLPDIVESGGDTVDSYAAAALMREKWGWSEPDDSYASFDYAESCTGMPTLAFTGPAFYSGIGPDGLVSPMAHFLKGTGHWELSYDGCTRVRNGAGNTMTMQLPDNLSVKPLPNEVF
jgi:hypothetical protein